MYFRCSWVPFGIAEHSAPAGARQDCKGKKLQTIPSSQLSSPPRTEESSILYYSLFQQLWPPLNMQLQSGGEQLQPRHLGIVSKTSPWDCSCMKYTYICKGVKTLAHAAQKGGGCPSLKTFQVSLYRALSNLIYLKMSLLMAGGPKPFYDSVNGLD